MVSDKVIVILLVVAIVLSGVSLVVTLSMNFDDFKIQKQPSVQTVSVNSRESAGVGVVVEEAKP